jgi:hypothetical protein
MTATNENLCCVKLLACISTITILKQYAKAMFPIAWKVFHSFSVAVTSTPTTSPVRPVLTCSPPIYVQISYMFSYVTYTDKFMKITYEHIISCYISSTSLTSAYVSK